MFKGLSTLIRKDLRHVIEFCPAGPAVHTQTSFTVTKNGAAVEKLSPRWCNADGRSFSKTLTSNGHVISVTVMCSCTTIHLGPGQRCVFIFIQISVDESDHVFPAKVTLVQVLSTGKFVLVLGMVEFLYNETTGS